MYNDNYTTRKHDHDTDRLFLDLVHASRSFRSIIHPIMCLRIDQHWSVDPAFKNYSSTADCI